MTEDLSLTKTSDINLAAALLCLGYDVKGIDNRNPSRVYFFFFESPELAAAIDDYWRGDLRVDPKELANSRRELLTRIREEAI